MESERENDVKQSESREEAAARILKCFEEGMRYQSEMGFVQKFPNLWISSRAVNGLPPPKTRKICPARCSTAPR